MLANVADDLGMGATPRSPDETAQRQRAAFGRVQRINSRTSIKQPQNAFRSSHSYSNLRPIPFSVTPIPMSAILHRNCPFPRSLLVASIAESSTSSVLHIMLLFRRPLLTGRLASPALRWPLLQMMTWRASSTVHLRNHILSVLERLCEVADCADDIFIAVDTQRYHRDKAEGEPGMPFDDSSGEVSLRNVSCGLRIQRSARRLIQEGRCKTEGNGIHNYGTGILCSHSPEAVWRILRRMSAP